MGTLRDSMSGKTTMKAVVEAELNEEVIEVATLSQGKPPSMTAMVTGAALIGLLRPRPHKALPKRFLLAVTPQRVVALKGTQISDEDGNDTGALVKGEIATWDRGEVAAHPNPDGPGGTLEIPGGSIPVFDRSIGDPRERRLFDAL